MLMCVAAVAVVTLLAHISCAYAYHTHYTTSFLKRSSGSLSSRNRRDDGFTVRKCSTRRYVVEHLIDCKENPIIAEFIGQNSEYCINTISNGNIFTAFKGFSDQIFNIGFLIMSYFVFKRSKNGFVDINSISDDDTDDDSDADTVDDRRYYTMDNTDGRSKHSDRSNSIQPKTCPQCNGSGRCIVMKPSSDADRRPLVCDLCDGSGRISYSPDSRAGSLRGLPTESSSASSWDSIE